jgi:hypothetical protein
MAQFHSMLISLAWNLYDPNFLIKSIPMFKNHQRFSGKKKTEKKGLVD